MHAVRHIMEEEKIRGVLVEENDCLQGIVVLWDLKKLRLEKQWNSPVKAFMNRKVTTISGEVAGYIEEIASASGSQSDKVTQIQAAVAEMDKVAQQNMAEAEELSAAMASFKTEEDATSIPRLPDSPAAEG